MASTGFSVRRAVAGMALALAATAGAAAAAFAHSLSPSLLVVRESADGPVSVTWKTPLLRMAGVDLRPVLPADCTATSPAEIHEEGDHVTATWSIDCGPAGLVGRDIGVEGLAASKTDALLHLELGDGRAIDTVLRQREPVFTVPGRESTWTVAYRYLELGVDHIVTGYDHLLFVLGLLLLASSFRMLVATVTAFTLGHSVTLTLAVLGIARVPSAPVEVLIAFSIFVLAVELARPGTSAGLLGRNPWSMALLFGLLHGLGFAAMLREVGLPSEAIPLALLSFNVGIELGQLAFVAIVLVLRVAARMGRVTSPAWARPAVVYAMGSLAAYWMIERSSSWWS